jgi:hypothetical protein
VLTFENLCQAASTAANAQTAALATKFSALLSLHQHTPPAGHSIKQSALHGGRCTLAVAHPAAKRTLTYPDAGGVECTEGKGSEEGPEEEAPGTRARAPEARTPEQRARSPDPLHLSARSTLPSHTPGQRAKGGDSGSSASSTPLWHSPDPLLSSATKTPSQQTPPLSLALDCLTPRAANTKAFGRIASPGVDQGAHSSNVTPLWDVPRSRHATQSACNETKGKTQISSAAAVTSLRAQDDDDSDDSLHEEVRQGTGNRRGDAARGPPRSSPGRHHVLDQGSPGQVNRGRERSLLTINK